MFTDELFSKYQEPYEIVKSFGGFFGSAFSAALIRMFFNELAHQPQFEIVFKRIFQITIGDTIDQWYHAIMS